MARVDNWQDFSQYNHVMKQIHHHPKKLLSLPIPFIRMLNASFNGNKKGYVYFS